MTDYLQKMAMLAKGSSSHNSSPNQYRYIFMRVERIVSEPSNLAMTVAYGIDVITNENVSVRLSSIDETASDFLAEKKYKTIIQAKEAVTKLYNGRNSREPLHQKRDKRHATYLCFEKCVALPNNNEPYLPFRSHWSKTISSQTDVEFIYGYSNITCVDERQLNTKESSGKIRAAATIVEYVRPLVLNEHEANYKKISHALRNKEPNLLREGCAKICIMENDQLLYEVTIKQSSSMHKGKNSYNQNIEYAMPNEPDISINDFVSPHHKLTNFGILKDIGRIALHVFCGINLDKDSFTANNEEYLVGMREVLQNLQNGTFTAKVVGLRVLRFGNEQINKLPKNGNYDPLIIFKRKIFNQEPSGEDQQEPSVVNVYVPIIFGIQRAPHDRRYIIFHERMSYNSAENKALEIQQLDESTPRPRSINSI